MLQQSRKRKFLNKSSSHVVKAMRKRRWRQTSKGVALSIRVTPPAAPAVTVRNAESCQTLTDMLEHEKTWQSKLNISTSCQAWNRAKGFTDCPSNYLRFFFFFRLSQRKGLNLDSTANSPLGQCLPRKKRYIIKGEITHFNKAWINQ